MVCIDMRARFIPVSVDCETPVRGTVVYVDYANKYFTAEYEYEGKKYQESFEFSDCDKAVVLLG